MWAIAAGLWRLSRVSFVGSRRGRASIAETADLEPVLRRGRLLLSTPSDRRQRSQEHKRRNRRRSNFSQQRKVFTCSHGPHLGLLLQSGRRGKRRQHSMHSLPTAKWDDVAGGLLAQPDIVSLRYKSNIRTATLAKSPPPLVAIFTGVVLWHTHCLRCMYRLSGSKLGAS